MQGLQAIIVLFFKKCIKNEKKVFLLMSTKALSHFKWL